jgi:hypothetical protein
MDTLLFMRSLQAFRTIIGENHWIVGGDFNIITSLVESEEASKY